MLARGSSPWILVCFASFAVFFSGCLRTPVPSGNGEEPPSASPTFVGETQYCWAMPPAVPSGRIQLLVDSSGSMIGFKGVVPSIEGWVSRAVSQMRDTSLEISQFRTCQFKAGSGVFGCSDSGTSRAEFEASSDTNLHEAIRAAQGFELTVILTDGVAATGGAGTGDCAGGVDAACVARALTEVIHSDDSGGSPSSWGLWILPIISVYDGLFFSEEVAAGSEFEADRVIKDIRSDFRVDAVIEGVRTGSSGQLQYKYRGPRPLLLIVLARWESLGRSAVQSLWEFAPYSGIETIPSGTDFSSRLACLPPYEVFPGFLNLIEWRGLTPVDDPAQFAGTMDAFLGQTPNGVQVALDCPADESGSGVYELEATKKPRVESGCVPLRMLPAFSFRFQPVNESDQALLSSVLDDYQMAESYDRLTLHLTCNKSVTRPCSNSPISTHWMGFMEYGYVADQLADSDSESEVMDSIRQLSTTTPSIQPHRIFGLQKVLELFFRRIQGDSRSIAVSRVEICHKD